MNRRELADLGEAHPGIGRTRGQVVVIDVQRHGWYEVSRQLNDGAAIAGAANPRPRSSGSSHTPCTWHDRARHGAEIGLEKHPVTVKDAERATRRNQLADVEAVSRGIALHR